MMSDDFSADLPGDLEDRDRLFNTSGPWTMRTCMDWDFLRQYRYVVGFQRAAEVLTGHAAQFRGDVDALAMPILFCYRQWAELRLFEPPHPPGPVVHVCQVPPDA